MCDFDIDVIVFFFSSRRRHTRFDCDWSSDVCSSDLYDSLTLEGRRKVGQVAFDAFWTWANNLDNYEMLSSGYGTEYGPSYGVFGDENPYAPLLWNHDHVTPHHRVVVNPPWHVASGRGRRV